MNTGCQPPYCHGTGGWCGCNCKCCPPPCCPIIAVYFECGSYCAAPTMLNAQIPSGTPWDKLPIQGLPQSELPEFDPNPILSENGRFSFGDSPCSIPCETRCVELFCGGFGMPCCCLELLNGKIYSVGNGYVDANETIILQEECGNAGTVLINGQPPPVFVQDCEEIIVTIVPDDPSCCSCTQVDVQCAPCSLMANKSPLWKRKIDPRTGKTKVNPTTGKPFIVMDRFELKKRVLARINQLKRRGKH